VARCCNGTDTGLAIIGLTPGRVTMKWLSLRWVFTHMYNISLCNQHLGQRSLPTLQGKY